MSPTRAEGYGLSFPRKCGTSLTRLLGCLLTIAGARASVVYMAMEFAFNRPRG